MPEAPAIESRPRLVNFGAFSFDFQNRLLSRAGTEIPLPPRVLGVLELLLERAGEVVSRQELLDQVWKDAFVTDTSLAEAVSFLRQGLGDDPQAPRYVQTVHRRGYRFLPPLTQPVARADTVITRPTVPEPLRPSIARDLAPWSITVACTILAFTALWQTVRRPAPEPPPVVRFRVQPTAGTVFDRRAPALALARDGRTLAWSACSSSSGTCELYVQPIDRLEATRLRGTEGALAPFFSPDGRWIGFFADGRLKKIATSGGSALTLANAPAPGGGSWAADGRIAFAGSPAGGLSITSDQGGSVEQLTTPRAALGEVRHLWPSWLADGRSIIFTASGTPLPESTGPARHPADRLRAVAIDTKRGDPGSAHRCRIPAPVRRRRPSGTSLRRTDDESDRRDGFGGRRDRDSARSRADCGQRRGRAGHHQHTRGGAANRLGG